MILANPFISKTTSYGYLLTNQVLTCFYFKNKNINSQANEMEISDLFS